MNASLTQKNDPVKKMAQAMTKMLGSDLSGFLDRNVFPIYKQAQLNRWMTENQSETGQWRDLSPEYLKYKKKKFAAYPGSGTKKIIAKDRLRSAAAGETSGLNKIVTPSGMTLAIDLGALPYARYVADGTHGLTGFDIMKFGDATIDTMRQAVIRYVKQGMSK